MRIFKIIIFFILSIFIYPHFAQAGVIFVEPEKGEFGVGDTIIARIRLDNQNECINAVETGIAFSENLEAADFSSGNSILSIWLTQPSTADMHKVNSERKLVFSGGIPGGYCGSLPGDIGGSDTLAEVVFKVKSDSAGEARIDILEESRLLKNDGKGTEAEVKMKGAAYSLKPEKTRELDEWYKRLKEDGLGPEPFVIELHKDPQVHEGKYYIVFTTLDKQTGIDHFEVLEIRPGDQIAEEGKEGLLDKLDFRKKPRWKRAQSPYLLEDQTLQSYIKVKAVDKTGNERIVEYFPDEERRIRQILSFKGIIMLLLIVAMAVLIFVIVRKRSLKKASIHFPDHEV